MGKTAVVVVHGMGQQKPMDTLRSFSANFKVEDDLLFSSPNRIIGDLETRRISYLKQDYDFYEFYWAHLVDEIPLSKILFWSFSLLFSKEKSNRFLKLKWKIFGLFAGILLVVGIVATGLIYVSLIFDSFKNTSNLLVSGLLVYFVFKLLIPFISKFTTDTVVQSLGDVVKYTVPSPQNVAVRNEIRKAGIEFISKLHKAEKSDKTGNEYDRIILVGHSLGSIVCYDILSHLFPSYQHTYDVNLMTDKRIEKIKKNMTKLEDIAEADSIDIPKFQNAQSALLRDFRKVGLQWRITDFITLGSPLTHAKMLFEEFDMKKKLREYPTCPPRKDKLDQSFFYNRSKVPVPVPNHAALFAFTRWTNIYFENDWIGGGLEDDFGAGIQGHHLNAETSWWTRNFPFLSHTMYWEPSEKNCVKLLNQILRNIRRYSKINHN